jgi:hypothetical protein
LAFQQHAREAMLGNDKVWTIAVVFESRDMLLNSHSEGNHLLGALFYVVFGKKHLRNSKPYVIAVSMLGYILPNILPPGSFLSKSAVAGQVSSFFQEHMHPWWLKEPWKRFHFDFGFLIAPVSADVYILLWQI